MSRFVADQLSAPLIARLSLANAIANADRAIVICSVDEHGSPHPAMLSSLEIVEKGAGNVRLAAHISSRTTRNLKTNGKLTLILVDEDAAYYIKGGVLLLSPSMRTAPHYAKFNLRVESVLEDSPTEYESARLASGIRVQREKLDSDTARQILQELLE